MKILITTGIYPPKIGGPAQYVFNLKIELEKMGHTVSIATFETEDYLPTGIRHIYFFFKILRQILKTDALFIFDTYSVGFPSVLAAKIFGKKSIIRTGGDFLWEQYVERTSKKVLFRNFYDLERPYFTQKEEIIFFITRWTLQNASRVIFSTEWQKEIFAIAYDLRRKNLNIIENYYGPKVADVDTHAYTFVASARNLKWKNISTLEKVFKKIQISDSFVALFTENLNFPHFMERIESCYAVILVSLGDISPNLILDAIRYNRPFICTKEVGIYERIKDSGIFVDPLNETEIENAVLRLLDKNEYEKAREKVRQFSYVHTWEKIAQEFIVIYRSTE